VTTTAVSIFHFAEYFAQVASEFSSLGVRLADRRPRDSEALLKGTEWGACGQRRIGNLVIGRHGKLRGGTYLINAEVARHSAPRGRLGAGGRFRDANSRGYRPKHGTGLLGRVDGLRFCFRRAGLPNRVMCHMVRDQPIWRARPRGRPSCAGKTIPAN
jgi:hypothetical protein